MLTLIAVPLGFLAYQRVTYDPIRYVAVSGDTMEGVAETHGVPVDGLREWNWMVDDPIEPNQVLHIWKPRRPEVEMVLDAVAILRARFAPDGLATPLRARVEPPKWTADGVRVGEADAEARLEMPKRKECLPRRVIEPIRPGEPARARAGLSNDQINTALAAQTPLAVRCIGDARNPGLVRVKVTVGCDGRVDAIEQDGDSGYPKKLVDCLLKVLRHTEFPAHDAKEGDSFTVPVEIAP